MPVTRLFKTYDVSGDLSPYRIAAHAATAGMIAQAAGPTDALIGTTDELGKQPNGRADVAMSDLPEVEAGAAVAYGDPLTSDAEGRAVKATASGQRIIGFALTAAQSDGEIIDYLFAPGTLALAAEPATPPEGA
ncbi:DUF2190 family protein [uncultured Desulfovibrio sp.]|uniref:DUF2190 family protein n=1 Tax=uncultured Desulfovibrio sp. TaxID=167968 RepID=UPI0020646283|nr:DUF2190 family protein [uncultured Desulfovibrio sp.]DAQ05260.1 MAG TPA: capsid fiber protein [Caudoviricetes sp.]